MWVELDRLEASAKAAREAKARKAAEATAAVQAAAAATEKPAVAAAAAEEQQPLSAFEAAPQIAEKISDTSPARDTQGAPDQGAQAVPSMKSLRSSRSFRRMPSISKRDSLIAVGSGTVPVEDLQHLEAEVEVQVAPIEEGDEAAHE